MTPRQPGETPKLREARRALKEQLTGEPGFVGIGRSADPDGRPVLIVFVVDARSPAGARAPRTILDIPVRVEIAGPARKQSRSKGATPES